MEHDRVSVPGPSIERRRFPRRPLVLSAHLSQASGKALPDTETIDVSPGGALLRMPANSAVVSIRQRLLVTFALDDGNLHVVGDVIRLAPGADGRLAAAIAFRFVDDDDRARLHRLVAPDHAVDRPADRPARRHLPTQHTHEHSSTALTPIEHSSTMLTPIERRFHS